MTQHETTTDPLDARSDLFEGFLEQMDRIRDLDGATDPDTWVQLLRTVQRAGEYAQELLALR